MLFRIRDPNAIINRILDDYDFIGVTERFEESVVALMMLLVWGLAVARGSFYLFSWRFIPSSRYGFPAIIPTVGFLCLGWWKLGWWLKDFMWTHYIRRVPAWLGLIGYWLFVIGLNGLAIFTVYQYYYG